MVVDGRVIGAGESPFIIAELSANHGGSIERALRIIDGAAEAGVDAIKFQAYTPDDLTLDTEKPGFIIEGNNPWKGRRLYELYADAATPYDWFPKLYSRARERGIIPFTTPFGAGAIEMLEALDTPAYKIASFEAVDHELMRACAETGKPILMSTGMCDKTEIAEALHTLQSSGASEVGIFRCNSGYPAELDEANLIALTDMIQTFELPIGYSDHTLGLSASVAACALGASMIEKHVIDASEPATADSSFSITPEQLEQLVLMCRDAAIARGEVTYGPSKKEKDSLSFRRSLYACRDIAVGEKITKENVRCVRPGFGLHPRHFPDVLGRAARRAISAGDPLSLDALK
ncbi:MAG: pseudaminic acid synthase [Candidatus Marinimicrobia bacterium]|nr:pseudaminic acid synthase [Candidatus Neomarinimicrobiota bacterium]